MQRILAEVIRNSVSIMSLWQDRLGFITPEKLQRNQQDGRPLRL